MQDRKGAVHSHSHSGPATLARALRTSECPLHHQTSPVAPCTYTVCVSAPAVLSSCFPSGCGCSQARRHPELPWKTVHVGRSPLPESEACPVRRHGRGPCSLCLVGPGRCHVPSAFADLALRPEDNCILSPVSPPSKSVTLGAVLGTDTGMYNNENKPTCLENSTRSNRIFKILLDK